MDVYGRSRARSQRASGLKSQLVFDQLNPIVIFAYYVIAITFSMVFIHPIFLVNELLMMIAVNLLAKNQKKTLGTLQGALFMMLFIVVMNPIMNNHGAHVIATFGGTVITAEAVTYGFLMALSLAILMLVFVSYNQSMTNHKFLYLFVRLSPQLTLLTMITMRFVPLFIRRFTNIKNVQRTRGVQMETGSVRARSHAGMRLMEVLLINSLVDALQTADSMTARGYGSQKRTSYQRYRFTQRDGWVLASLVAGSALCFYFAKQGIGRLAIYPILGSIHLNQIGWLCLVLVLLIDSLPLLLEGWEYLWWTLRK
ncbi:cobalt ABC transporter permease protein [Latilactobacillus curvatus]|nr:cobalt ABC transporter permease protein [Latilactobacillus curvatus]